jgi:hypothetical protein
MKEGAGSRGLDVVICDGDGSPYKRVCERVCGKGDVLPVPAFAPEGGWGVAGEKQATAAGSRFCKVMTLMKLSFHMIIGKK